MWHYGDYLLPKALNGRYTNVAIQLAWSGFCGLTPILNLIMNRDLRSRVWTSLGGTPRSKSEVTIRVSSFTKPYSKSKSQV
ncbi:unnamed protein product [Bursaphelenchus okinawaensis]|uniref:Uncharacterized protein n=1 Tax=Bursaphelenchus okinawaensis TaxID=465554 RepID=A0A811LNL1_9BILA|nr:unnamed protein product [Bursaphelenchus okinawaensis]CAG9124841.1 unnamed protein product [Bursaphelenchus okinawaensis]